MNLPALFPVIMGIIGAVLTCLPAGEPPAGPVQSHYRIMFYNTENFFDTRNDSLTADDEYTAQGALHWTYKRYNTKLNNLFKTVIALGGWQPPDIIGVCEVENRFVLSDLLNHTPLLKYEYRIIHANSADRRGIDVALLYNSKTVAFLQSRYFNLHKPGLLTRDILYFKALIKGDTCHFIINHWPSRSSGQLKTETDRLWAASILRFVVDSLFEDSKNAKIIILGDFNDEPGDESMLIRLKAQNDLRDPLPSRLYNLSSIPKTGKYRGTVKFQGQWNLFDQVIVSGSLLCANHGVFVLPDGYQIFGAPFLLTADEKYNGFKPYRTYIGYRYQGGFSDHLPVYVDLYVKSNW
jgi:endonuclease/exonuclease/phosphatase family metal-dependent hydrolase